MEGFFVYDIRRGDTLCQIAKLFDVSVEALKTENGLTADLIRAGDPLKIPAKPDGIQSPYEYTLDDGTTKQAVHQDCYLTVKKGDTAWALSQRIGLKVSDLVEATRERNAAYVNASKNLWKIEVGDKIYLPVTNVIVTPSSEEDKKKVAPPPPLKREEGENPKGLERNSRRFSDFVDTYISLSNDQPEALNEEPLVAQASPLTLSLGDPHYAEKAFSDLFARGILTDDNSFLLTDPKAAKFKEIFALIRQQPYGKAIAVVLSTLIQEKDISREAIMKRALQLDQVHQKTADFVGPNPKSLSPRVLIEKVLVHYQNCCKTKSGGSPYDGANGLLGPVLDKLCAGGSRDLGNCAALTSLLHFEFSRFGLDAHYMVGWLESDINQINNGGIVTDKIGTAGRHAWLEVEGITVESTELAIRDNPQGWSSAFSLESSSKYLTSKGNKNNWYYSSRYAKGVSQDIPVSGYVQRLAAESDEPDNSRSVQIINEYETAVHLDPHSMTAFTNLVARTQIQSQAAPTEEERERHAALTTGYYARGLRTLTPDNTDRLFAQDAANWAFEWVRNHHSTSGQGTALSYIVPALAVATDPISFQINLIDGIEAMSKVDGVPNAPVKAYLVNALYDVMKSRPPSDLDTAYWGALEFVFENFYKDNSEIWHSGIEAIAMARARSETTV